MTIKLASLRANLAREENGDWVNFPDWPGVAFLVSSIHAPAYKSAFQIMTQRLSRIYKGKPVPVEEQHEELGQIYCKHLLRGWRGLDVQYSADKALEVLCDPAYREVLAAVGWCADKISELQVEFLETKAKNSARPSGDATSSKAKSSG
jgi:hypothetical protein